MTDIVQFNPVTELGAPEQKAQIIKQVFDPMFTAMQELEDEYNSIVSETEITGELTVKAKALHKRFRQISNQTAQLHKEAKAEYLLLGRVCDGYKNAQIAAAGSKETNLKKIIDHFDNIEKERIQAKQDERAAKLLQYGMPSDHMDLGRMADDIFDNMLLGAKTSHEARLKAEEDARLQREKDEADKRTYQERKESLMKFGVFSNIHRLEIGMTDGAYDEVYQKATAEFEAEKKRVRDLEIENEKIRKKAEADAAELERVNKLWRGRLRELESIVWDGQAAKYKDEEVISYDDLISIDDKAFAKVKKSHNAKVKRDIKAQKEKDAELQRLRDQEAEQERQRLKEAEDKRQLSLKGDKERMTVYIDTIKLPTIDIKTIKDPEVIKVYRDMVSKHSSFKAWCKTRISEVK